MQPKPEVTYWIVQYDAAGGRNLTSSSLMTVGAVRDQLKWLVETKHATNLRVREYHMVTTSRDVTDAFRIVAEATHPYPGVTATVTTVSLEPVCQLPACGCTGKAHP